ncbi:MAG: hypothetical protein N3G80_03750 [Candidatus Micrarchaeota archaeon]|nr:hypothetical protein [Candidatus Micrarchaeota archaeon]
MASECSKGEGIGMIDIRYLSYGAAGIGLLGALGCFGAGGNPILTFVFGLMCMLGSVGAVALYKYGYLIIPFLTKQGNIVQIIEGGYEIPPSNDVIIKNVGGIYYASKFLGVRIFESASEKSTEENIVYSEYFERAISSVKYVTKFALMVYMKDITEYRNRIETKHAEAQLRLARERDKPDPDVLKLDRYEKEVAMWENQINKLTRGIKPMGVVSYVMTTAVGVSKEAAIAAATAQANELKATISNALNVQVELLSGDEMLRCFQWETMIPPNPQELEQTLV